MNFLHRLWLGTDDLGSVVPWNPVIADRHAVSTERMLLGAAGRSRVVGNRRDEKVIADRELRAAEMARRQVSSWR